MRCTHLLLGFTQFFRSRYAAVGYLNFAFVNFDPFKHRFHDFTLPVGVQFRLLLVERFGFVDDFLG